MIKLLKQLIFKIIKCLQVFYIQRISEKNEHGFMDLVLRNICTYKVSFISKASLLNDTICPVIPSCHD